MSGTLYICGTPIGNLEDISLRVIRLLKEVDIIAAEDTRHTIKLLNHYQISTNLTSYHQHNMMEKGKQLVKLLENGKNIALVTDAGMPSISDPGQNLVKVCHQKGITVTSAPGPTALTTALALSGLDSAKFIFEGFLPQHKRDRMEILTNYKNETKTIVFYEAPHHLKKTLDDIFLCMGEREISIVREITKKYEEILNLPISMAIEHYTQREPKGEYVLILEGISKEKAKELERQQYDNISLESHLDSYLNKGLTKNEAIKAVAKDRGVSKREVYGNFNTNCKLKTH